MFLEEQVYADPIKKIQEEMYQQLIVLREGLYQTLDAACSAGGVPSSHVCAASTAAAPVSGNSELAEEVK